MPVFELQTQDGRKFQVDAPDQQTAVKSLGDHANMPVLSQGQALVEGLKSGASAGFIDEMTGLGAASGIPEGYTGTPKAPGIGPLTPMLVGGAHLAYEKLFGDDSKPRPVEQNYAKARDEVRARQKAASEEFPKTYFGGEVAGALALPAGGEAMAPATLGARTLRSAAIGAGYGAASGFGQGEGLADSASRAVVGAGVGALTGGVGVPVLEGAGAVASRAAAPIVNRIRGVVRPEDEAARRVVAAINRDVAADPAAETRLRPAEFAASRMQPSGGPAAIMDLGGETTRAMARSAANTSPEGRAALNRTVNDRFGQQSARVVGWLQDTFNYPDAHALQEAIDSASRNVNRSAYARANVHPNANALWDEGFEQIMQAPVVQEAARNATRTGANQAALAGFTPVARPFEFHDVGSLTPRYTQRVDDQGRTVLPNLAFWDHVKRNLDDRINSLTRSGEMSAARDARQLRAALVDRLDQRVPPYAQARASAAAFFGAENALEAGQNFVTSRLRNRDAIDALARMSPVERRLFQDGFVSRFIDHISEIGDRRNVLNQIAASPAARQRLSIAIGPQRAAQLEAGLRVEGIMDLARGAVQGNSTTARQLTELGLAGGTNDVRAPTSLTQIAVDAIGHALNWGRRHIDQRVSRRVAEMLASNDPAVLTRGLRVVARNGRFLEGLRAADRRIAALSGEQAGNIPALQAAGVGRADQGQPDVPGPRGQQ